MSILQKRKKNPMCVLTHVSIAIEEENFNMRFGNDMKILYTLYLSNGKQIKRMGIASLVLAGSLYVNKV
jgi:hypothetical protein